MILMIILSVLLVASIIGIKLSCIHYFDWDCSDFLQGLCCFICLLTILLTICFGAVAICRKVNHDENVYEKELVREDLVASYNQYMEEYENDIVNSELYNQLRTKINKFNVDIYHQNKWKKSIWIGWYYRDYSSIKPIEIVDGAAR